ncbi:hypothetical protein AHF37_00412 [Paragonimus kellicotti]|nr:hypothetical protein AHF37_00412 [Paragonimus kellicotti]
MSTDNAMIGFETTDSSDVANPTDLLDFLNSSDNELDDPKPTDPTEQSDAHSEADSANEESPSLTLSINNVVVMASMQCHLRLKELARSSVNVEYKPLQNHVIMRLRSPYTVATIWSSGKIWCTGANSLAKAKTGARRIARRIAKCGFPCRFSKFRVVNIMATCHLPFRVRLEELVKEKPLLMSHPILSQQRHRSSLSTIQMYIVLITSSASFSRVKSLYQSHSFACSYSRPILFSCLIKSQPSPSHQYQLGAL